MRALMDGLAAAAVSGSFWGAVYAVRAANLLYCGQPQAAEAKLVTITIMLPFVLFNLSIVVGYMYYVQFSKKK